MNVGYRETAGGKQYGFDGEKIVFSVSDPEIADVNYDNHLNITGTGVITVNANGYTPIISGRTFRRSLTYAWSTAA